MYTISLDQNGLQVYTNKNFVPILINCNCFPVQELSFEMDFLIFASLQSILLLKFAHFTFEINICIDFFLCNTTRQTV